MEVTEGLMGGGLGATILGPLFLQRTALWSESCHILFISWRSAEAQVRVGTHMAGALGDRDGAQTEKACQGLEQVISNPQDR